MSRRALTLASFLGWCLIGAVPTAQAQQAGAANPTGGSFVQVDDGLPRSCINVTKSLVSAYIVAVKGRQNTSWLPSWIVATKNVGVKVNLSLTDPSSQQAVFNFPRAKVLQPVGSSNVINLPLRLAILQRYDLINRANNPATPIAGFTIDVNFINVEAKGAAATVFGQLVDFTKTLPVPPNPYTSGVQLFGDFANKVVDATIASDNTAALTDLGSFSYDLATTDNECTTNPRALSEGTTGVIFDYFGNDLAGIIKTSDVVRYCFRMSALNVGHVEFAERPNPDFDCFADPQRATLKFSPLNNAQIVFSFTPIAKLGAGTVVRVVPSANDAAVASSHAPASDSLVSALAARLAGETSATDFKGNAASWLQTLRGGDIPKAANAKPVGTASSGLRPVEMPAERAREYDAARAAVRCSRNGLALQDCI